MAPERVRTRILAGAFFALALADLPSQAAETAAAPVAAASPLASSSPSPDPTPVPRRVTRKLEEEEKQIPKRPSAPPILAPQTPPQTFHCERFLTYKGKRIACDSFLGRDAGGLKRLVADVPEALAEMEIYQNNRKKMYTTAYVGSVGLLMFFLSNFIPPPPESELRSKFFWGGVGIIAGSGLYGLSLLRTNETHLGKAVEHYNRARPESTIELEFSTGVLF